MYCKICHLKETTQANSLFAGIRRIAVSSATGKHESVLKKSYFSASASENCFFISSEAKRFFSMESVQKDKRECVEDDHEHKSDTGVSKHDEVSIQLYGNLKTSNLSFEERYKLCLSVGECVTEEDLKNLLQRKQHPICYDGFEPSGRMHIAQGIQKAINVNKLTQCGCVFVFWVADWFALLNNKLGGDLEKIKSVGQYFIEVWKAVGMDMTNVRFLWASDEINNHASTYWLRVMEISRLFTVSRIKRCSQIMGRVEGDEQPAAQILYPCMQCSDIFHLKADICQLGLDQRKVNMLAREFCDKKEYMEAPVILSHPMLPGLQEGQDKMSKSDTSSSIFMEDTAEDVNAKIKKAFCPPKQIEGNPCIAYTELIVFPMLGVFKVHRSEKNGGDITYSSVDELKAAYASGELHPADLKSNLAKCINNLLSPVRKHFETDPFAKKLLEKISTYSVTK